MAVREQRILITEDRDFGQLVYATAQPFSGVIYVRFPSRARAALPGMVVDVVTRRGEQLVGRFSILQPGRFRLGGIPRD
jgi:predicted nuclease of predicted toxin-antitoxin system